MGAIGFFEMLIAILVLAATIGVPIAIVVALVKGRPGDAAAVAGAAVMIVVGITVFAAILYTVAESRSMPATTLPPMSVNSSGTAHITFNGVEHSWPVSGDGVTKVGVGLVPVLFICCGALFLFAMALHRGFAHAVGGHRLLLPALMALTIVMFLIGSVRYRVSSNSNAQQAAIQAAQHTEVVQQQLVAAAQQATNEQRAALMAAEVQKRIETMDIHELMDRFDAPRIVLQVPSAPSSAPILLALAAATQQSDSPPAVPGVPEPPQPPVPSAAPPQADPPQATPPAKSSKHKPKAKPAAPPAKETIAAVDNVKVQSDALAVNTVAKPSSFGGAKPEWINTPPKRMGDVRRELIETEEYATPDECYQAADVYLLLKTYEHVQQLLNRPYQEGDLPSVTFINGSIFANGNLIAAGRNSPHWVDYRPRYLDSLGIGLDFIRREIVAKDPKTHESREYLETVERSVGPMKKLYMQMEFTPAIDRQIQLRLESLTRQDRIGMVGASAASVLMLLGGVWVLLKVDTATKGYYTKRLFLGVPLGILGLFGMYAALVQLGFDLPH